MLAPTKIGKKNEIMEDREVNRVVWGGGGGDSHLVFCMPANSRIEKKAAKK